MKKSKDYQWLIWVIIITISVLASSCSSDTTKYKGHIVGQSVKRIVTEESGYVAGDTIIIQVGYKYTNLVIESIIK